MLTENITLRDGFQTWEGDVALDGGSLASNLLVQSSELTEAFCPVLTVPVAALAGLSRALCTKPIVHAPTANQKFDPRAGAKGTAYCEALVKFVDAQLEARNDPWASQFVARDEDTGRVSIFSDRKRIAYTASLAVPTSGHVGQGDGIFIPNPTDCTCEKNDAARRLYLNGEYGVALYESHDWDTLSQAFDKYNSLPKNVRDGWLSGNGAMQRMLRSHLALKQEAFEAEQNCRSDRHYFGLELEAQLDGSPEISAPAAKTVASHPPNKYGICYPIIEAVKYAWLPDRPMPEDVTTIPRFVKVATESNNAALEEIEAHEVYEFAKSRSPLIASMNVDEDRGYAVNPAHKLNETSLERLDAQIKAETTRRQERGDVWLSPKRGTRHVWHFESSRGVYVHRRTKGWSPFYAHQQRVRAADAARKNKTAKLAALVEKLDLSPTDPRVMKRIAELGLDAAIVAITTVIEARKVEEVQVRTI